jgi:hypothetical protein
MYPSNERLASPCRLIRHCALCPVSWYQRWMIHTYEQKRSMLRPRRFGSHEDIAAQATKVVRMTSEVEVALHRDLCQLFQSISSFQGRSQEPVLNITLWLPNIKTDLPYAYKDSVRRCVVKQRIGPNTSLNVLLHTPRHATSCGNPILFAICTSTFSKLYINVYSGM